MSDLYLPQHPKHQSMPDSFLRWLWRESTAIRADRQAPSPRTGCLATRAGRCWTASAVPPHRAPVEKVEMVADNRDAGYWKARRTASKRWITPHLQHDLNRGRNTTPCHQKKLPADQLLSTPPASREHRVVRSWQTEVGKERTRPRWGEICLRSKCRRSHGEQRHYDFGYPTANSGVG